MDLTAAEVAERCSWKPSANSTIHRWHTRGARLSDGTVIKLNRRRSRPGRFVFDSDEVDAFLKRIEEDC